MMQPPGGQAADVDLQRKLHQWPSWRRCMDQPLAQAPTCLASRDGAFYEPAAAQVCAGPGGAEQQSHDARRVESRNMGHRNDFVTGWDI